FVKSSSLRSITSCLCAFLCLRAAPTAIYTLSLHDALPISRPGCGRCAPVAAVAHAPTRNGRAGAVSGRGPRAPWARPGRSGSRRSEEHTSELQSRENLVCRLLLEKKKKLIDNIRREETLTL